MSITSILATATSGLRTSQTGLRVVSDNVANVNTPGYVRKIMDQTSLALDGVGQGVDVARIRLAADRFLQAASQNAGARAAEAGVSAEFLDSAQSLFGDPAGSTSFFDKMDAVFTTLAAAAEDPTSPVRRSDALNTLETFFEDAERIAAGLRGLRSETDSRIASGVTRANQLLQDIEALNVEISRSSVAGRSASDAENQQAALIDELSTLVDLKSTPRGHGGVQLRTSSGVLLAGDGAATLSYARGPAGGSGSAQASYGEILVTAPGGQAQPLLDHVNSGELKGLVTARDRELPALSEQLSEFVSKTADELNRAHNAASAAPAPARLSGRSTGLDLDTAIAGFTGRATVATVDSAGQVTRRVDIDFTARTLSVNGGGATAFTPAGFLGALDGALDPLGDATVNGTALTISARTGGVAVVDDPTTPANRGGRGFAHFFGLNDLVRSAQPPFYETGLRTTDPHGFTGDITLRLAGQNGVSLREVTVTPPAAGDMQDLLDELNRTSGGVGLYGQFALDSQGRLGFTPTSSPPVVLSVTRDGTSRGSGGPSLSALFGIDAGQRSARAAGFSVNGDIAQDPRRLAMAQFNAAATVGQTALSSGDGRGGRVLAQADERMTAFAGGRDFGAATLTLSRYSAEFSGGIGTKAASAEGRRTGAQAVAAEAQARRISAEGVNLDEELVLLTTYQQAYNASARLIQAAKDMYDVLLELP
jgi:flagellar hook-associated protein 1 FlgK